MRVIAFHRGVSARGSAVKTLTESLHQYCELHHHRCLKVLGPEKGYLKNNELAQQYRELVNEVTDTPVLVLLPNATHLADNLAEFVERVLELQNLKSDVECAENDLPDPLQNALLTLGASTTKGKVSPEAYVRAQKKIIGRAAEGTVVGRLPYGYCRGKDGRYEIDPIEAHIVQRIFSLYTGVMVDGRLVTGGPIGLRRIARTFNTEGLRTRHSKPWNPVTLSNLLRNRAYLGSYHRYGIRIVANHEPVVTRDQFDLAQRLMEMKRPRQRRASVSARFMLIGLARCSLCNEHLKGVSRRRMWRNEDGQQMERTYRYYECPLRSTTSDMGHTRWTADKLHKAFYAWVTSLNRQDVTTAISRYQERGQKHQSTQQNQVDRKFLGVVQNVVKGHGSKFDLMDALERIRTTGEVMVTPRETQPQITQLDDLVNLSASAYTKEAQDVANSLVESVVVGKRKAAFTALV